MNGKCDEHLYKAVNDNNYLPEVFKTLVSPILHPLDGKAIPKAIMITSALPKEGKNIVTANVGVSLAHDMHQHSLLVEELSNRYDNRVIIFDTPPLLVAAKSSVLAGYWVLSLTINILTFCSFQSSKDMVLITVAIISSRSTPTG